MKDTDIAVKEDDAEGKVLKLEPIDWPIRVAMLIDNGTGSADRLNHTREGVKGLIKALPARRRGVAADHGAAAALPGAADHRQGGAALRAWTC